MKNLLLAAICAAALAPALPAWNNAGHMTTAYIAYQRLSPEVRQHVDEVLRRHPDYPRWIKNAPQGADRGLEAFLQAAIWPDVIKGDERFWDPSSSSRNTPTPLQAGFTDMQQHRNWHYRDMPVSAPGAPQPQPEEPNLVSVARAFLENLNDPYKLAWFIHLAADAHQPLHAASRFQAAGDKGDAGGNAVLLEHPAKNLHAYWDGLIGRDMDRAAIAKAGDELIGRFASSPATVHTDLETWMRESYRTAKEFTYSAPAPTISQEYDNKAQEIARRAAALAGLRIAAVLNDRLQ